MAIVIKKCIKCGELKEMYSSCFRCVDCGKKKCIICGNDFSVSPCNDKQQCCSQKCMRVFLKTRELTPEQKLRHDTAMHKVFLSQKVDGLRMCRKCKQQKEENLFAKCGRSKIKNTGLCLKCKRKADHICYFKHIKTRKKTYRKNMQDPIKHAKIRKINTIAVSKRRAGLNRIETILPHTQCYVCGITQAEHLDQVKNRFGNGVSLSIHHIDNKGRRAMAMGFKPNNSPDNLMILCSADHCRQHNHERDYTGLGFKIWKTRRKNLLLKQTA